MMKSAGAWNSDEKLKLKTEKLHEKLAATAAAKIIKLASHGKKQKYTGI